MALLRVPALCIFGLSLVTGCSSSGSSSSPTSVSSDAGAADTSVAATPDATSGTDAAAAVDCTKASQSIQLSAVTAAISKVPTFSGVPKGTKTADQLFLDLSDTQGAVTRTLTVEFYTTTLAVGKTFDIATQGTPGGADTGWSSYFEASAAPSDGFTPKSGKITVVCATADFLGVTLKDVVYETAPNPFSDAGPTGTFTANGFMAAPLAAGTH